MRLFNGVSMQRVYKKPDWWCDSYPPSSLSGKPLEEFECETMRPCTKTWTPSLPVSMLLMSKSVEETAAQRSYRMAYNRVTIISVAMSVLAGQAHAITFQELVQAMQTIDDLVRQIDKSESILNTTHSKLVDMLRMCPFVRFRENRGCLESSQVSLVDVKTINTHELERWSGVCGHLN